MTNMKWWILSKATLPIPKAWPLGVVTSSSVGCLVGLLANLQFA